MNGSHRTGVVILSTLLCALLSPWSFSDSGRDEARLQQLRARIDALQERLNQTRGQRDAVREEVRELERRIGQLLRGLSQTDARVRANGKKLDELQTRAARERGQADSQRRQLGRQVHTAYVMGRAGYPKMLLNQESPAGVARVMVYYRYLNRDRAERIAATRTTLERLGLFERQIQEQTRELEVSRAAQSEQKTAFETARARRGQLLASLNREVHSRAQEIDRLRADEKRLESLLDELKTVLPESPRPTGPRFAKWRGRLPLPTRGRILARYGAQKNVGDLKWRGLLIGGHEGQNVISVFHGRVVYADWLRGFGLLLILEHGDGYMTLYGHNQGLHKAVGDWVEAGEVIASLGNTGDTAKPGLYFEIRQNGEPHNPLIWCKAR